MALRLIPGMVTLRPADANEVTEAWKIALERRDGPVAIVLTRQDLPILDRSVFGAVEGVRKGAYVVREAEGPLQVVLIATGSELGLALKAREQLAAEGVGARVVSMPSWELFAAQDAAYRASVLPPHVPRVSVEAGRTWGWERWIGDGEAVGIDHYGASAPAEVLAEKFGLTAARVHEAARRLLAR